MVKMNDNKRSEETIYNKRIFDKVKEEIENKGEVTQKEVDEIIFHDKQKEFIEHSTDMAHSF